MKTGQARFKKMIRKFIELCEDKSVMKFTAEGDKKLYLLHWKYYMRSTDEDRKYRHRDYTIW